MPICEVYSGKTSVSATSKNDFEKTIYSNSKTAYGQTLGELFDNLVAESVVLAVETYKWIAMNKPQEYTLKDDYWSASTSNPDILESHMKQSPEAQGEDYDTGSGGSIDTVRDIVVSAVLHRDLSINSAANSLRVESEDRSIFQKIPMVPYSNIYELLSFEEMIKCGHSGSELEEILKISEHNGILKKYLDRLSVLREFQQRKSKELERQAKKTEKKRKKQS